MTQRTANIMAIAKGLSQKYDSGSMKRNIALYMTDECGIESADKYTDVDIDNIIMNAFLDYLDSADRPSIIAKEVFFNNFSSIPTSYSTNILKAFVITEVKRDNKFVNGWSQELIDGIKKSIDPKPVPIIRGEDTP